MQNIHTLKKKCQMNMKNVKKERKRREERVRDAERERQTDVNTESERRLARQRV